MALLTYGQSTDPASPHGVDQLRLYSTKQWPRLPFHADEVERDRKGAVLRLVSTLNPATRCAAPIGRRMSIHHADFCTRWSAGAVVAEGAH